MMEKKVEDRELRAMGALAYRLVRMGWMNAAKLEKQVAALHLEAGLKPVKNQPKSAPPKRGRGRPKKPKDIECIHAGLTTRLINVLRNMPDVKDEDVRYLSQLAKLTVAQLLREPNCGKTTLKQAQEVLLHHGYSFPDADRLK